MRPLSPSHRPAAVLAFVLLLTCTWSPPTQAEGRTLKLIGGLGDLDDGGGLTVNDPGFAVGRADTSYGGGLVAGLAFGIDRGRFTFELDYLYRSNEFDQVTFADGRTVTDGNYASVTIGANAYLRFRPETNLQPYLGGGVGWVQEVDVDFEENGIETSFETDDIGLQWTAGIRWTPGARWSLDAQLRWLDVSGLTMEAESGPGRVVADYAPVSVLISAGWRW